MRFLLVFLVGCGGTDFKGILDEAGAADGSKGNDASSGAGDSGKDAASCDGTHPIVDGGARYCSAGNCYCAPSDKCMPAAVAQACCNDTVKCAN